MSAGGQKKMPVKQPAASAVYANHHVAIEAAQLAEIIWRVLQTTLHLIVLLAELSWSMSSHHCPQNRRIIQYQSATDLVQSMC